MKNNEPFEPSKKSSAPPKGILFRLALEKDRDGITKIMAERNPDLELSAVMKTTDREIELNSNDPNYRLFVADLNGKIVGICRYYHSEGIPKEKLVYPAPSGWYCMGISVDKDFRRQGIARFLFQNRLKAFREHGAKLIYSMVDVENLSSVKMHQEFGFVEVKGLGKAEGFLHIKFKDSVGILYQMTL